MKSKVAGIASAAAVVVAVLSVALGSTFARAGKQDVVAFWEFIDEEQDSFMFSSGGGS